MPGNLRTRFIIDRKLRIRTRDDGSLAVLAGVFLPLRNDDEGGRWELSTFGIDRIEDDEDVVWQLAFEHYLPDGRSLKGRADLATRYFAAEGLSFVTQVPPPRHGSHIDWPDDASHRDAIAASLAAKASGVPYGG